LLTDRINNFSINKNSICKVSYARENDYVQIKNEENFINIDLKKISFNNFYRVWKTTQNIYVEILSTSFNNLKQKLKSKNFEVYIYETAIRVIYKEECTSHVYNSLDTSYMLEDDNFLYLFNSKNILILDIKNFSFSLFKKEKIIKINKNIK